MKFLLSSWWIFVLICACYSITPGVDFLCGLYNSFDESNPLPYNDFKCSTVCENSTVNPKLHDLSIVCTHLQIPSNSEIGIQL